MYSCLNGYADDLAAVVRNHFEDFVNNRRADVIRQNMAPGFVDHDGPGGTVIGVACDELLMRRMFELMTDLRLTIEELIAEGDKVIVSQHLAMDRSGIRKEDAVSWLRLVALRRKQDCRTLGNSHAALGRDRLVCDRPIVAVVRSIPDAIDGA